MIIALYPGAVKGYLQEYSCCSNILALNMHYTTEYRRDNAYYLNFLSDVSYLFLPAREKPAKHRRLTATMLAPVGVSRK